MNDQTERRTGGPAAGGSSPSAQPGTPRRRPGASKKLANGLVALGSAAVVAVYAAGYVQTAPAAASVASAAPATATVRSTATTSSLASVTALLTPTPATAPAAATATATTTARAAAATTVPATPTRAAQATTTGATLRDGTYVGTGSSRHGSIEATVVIQAGKIASAQITGCGTRYPCSRIAALPGQVVARQSAAVDFVSGATDSSTAYRGAIAAALAQAR